MAFGDKVSWDSVGSVVVNDKGVVHETRRVDNIPGWSFAHFFTLQRRIDMLHGIDPFRNTITDALAYNPLRRWMIARNVNTGPVWPQTKLFVEGDKL